VALKDSNPKSERRSSLASRRPRPTIRSLKGSSPAVSNNPQLLPKWYSPAEVAVLLGYGLSKVKNKIATGELRSIKDGKYRRILPEWVDEYVRNLADQQDVA
jgi:excisionase family DNA binding protein